jgi:hypothetical protein
MMKKTIELTGTTDANGFFQHTEKFKSPLPINCTVELSVKLLSPTNLKIAGMIDVDAADGNPQNDAKEFTLDPGVLTSLGKWKIGHGQNIVVVSAKTLPPSPDTEIKVQATASL